MTQKSPAQIILEAVAFIERDRDEKLHRAADMISQLKDANESLMERIDMLTAETAQAVNELDQITAEYQSKLDEANARLAEARERILALVDAVQNEPAEIGAEAEWIESDG